MWNVSNKYIFWFIEANTGLLSRVCVWLDIKIMCKHVNRTDLRSWTSSSYNILLLLTNGIFLMFRIDFLCKLYVLLLFVLIWSISFPVISKWCFAVSYFLCHWHIIIYLSFSVFSHYMWIHSHLCKFFVWMLPFISKWEYV